MADDRKGFHWLWLLVWSELPVSKEGILDFSDGFSEYKARDENEKWASKAVSSFHMNYIIILIKRKIFIIIYKRLVLPGKRQW